VKRILLALTSAAVVAACAEQPTSTTAIPLAVGNALLSAGPLADYAATPAGYYHRSCVHEIPRGARVDSGGLVTRRDGSTYRIPKCEYPPFGTVFDRVRTPWPQITDSNWIEWAQDTLDSPNRFVQLSARWLVPSAPAGTFSSGQNYYAFPGLLSFSDLGLAQPVIQYGYNPGWGGNVWTMASFYVTPTNRASTQIRS
jgi:hypothetical protein